MGCKGRVQGRTAVKVGGQNGGEAEICRVGCVGKGEEERAHRGRCLVRTLGSGVQSPVCGPRYTRLWGHRREGQVCPASALKGALYQGKGREQVALLSRDKGTRDVGSFMEALNLDAVILGQWVGVDLRAKYAPNPECWLRLKQERLGLSAFTGQVLTLWVQAEPGS